ncbi:jumonji domain containing 1C, transcript variant X1 [Ictidomys tridecemlineatus]|uniref:probable JmjC domain-containing histone demethylation protein 2C isoform X2 n=1 Tax=Ictidomys tridecemlineatus TaxID=43179 RepID=UPI00038C16D0|nr:probable JmjC domain-containing histone demethylation protein 2C isoform X2 [Ictidomys tridecemlineatus]KAG3264842.1 jumonji domain containing 1C, transcript variant X1 [Ictidomys tridecemlineatus]
MAVESRPELVGKRFLCVAIGEEVRPERGESGRCRRSWRAGVIRAVSHRDSRNPDLAVYVEFDDLEWDKREWVKVYEDFSTFLVEYHLIWAKRNDPSQTQGSKSKQIQWPALTFKPLVEKSIPSSITAVEFLIDKQLDFLTEDSAFQLYQDDIDSLNPVLRDNPQLHEEVKVWVKEQKVQEIFMQGPYSLNGYRVRVYRQDSATQWFTGIITHHDLFTRTMIVMNDQVLEPQNVDPSMVQMTFLDDVVHSLLKGENIGITSRRRSRANQNINTVHGHYTRAQANSPRPAMNSQTAVPKQNTHQQQQQRNIRPNKRKGSDSSIPDEEKMKEEKYDYISRGDNPKGKNKHLMNKRRKPEEDEKKLNMKRLRTDNVSDFSESSDSENSNKRIIDNSSEQKSENELKNKNTSKINGEEGKSQNSEKVGEETLVDIQTPWDQIHEDKNHEEAEKQKSVDIQFQEKVTIHSSEQATLAEHNPKDLLLQECNMENTHTVELLPKEKFISRPSTPKCVIDITKDANLEKVVQENSSTFGLQTLEKIDPKVNDSKHSIVNSKYLETAKQDSDQNWVSDVIKVDLTQPSVINASSGNDQLDMEKEKNQYISYTSSLSAPSVTEDKANKPSPPPETIKSKLTASVDTHKTKPNSSPEVVKPKITHSPDSVKSKATYVNSQATGERRLTNELSRCSFHPVPTRGSALETTKSPLIIDKNEHFTVYRDPALIGSEAGANHISPFLSQHPFPLHSTSHRTCLNPGTHHPALNPASHLLAGSSSQTPLPTINTHPLTSGPHHSVHHPHLLPTVLPGVPTASLLGGHPRLESAHASSLSHLALAHQQQQQLLQHQSPHLLGQAHPSASYNQLGLYPIIWQYPNGTHAYSGLGLPSPKWVHPENAVSAEASLRRNSPSPWLHQHTPVTSADGIGLLSHIPVRPSSAEPHRPLKITTHSSPPLTKPVVDHHKEELERKAFMEPLRSVASTSVKNDLDLNRSQTGKECHLHRHFVDPVLNQSQRPPQETGERLNKYKEEHRRILQESIDVAPFTTKIKGLEGERENYSRVTASSSSPKSHVIKQDKDVERSVSELYKMKHPVPQSLPQSNYFTTLSNSVVNEPPRSYPSKEVSNIYTEKQSNSLATAANPQTLTSFISSLSKPPPLIKHQPESESLVGKIPEHLPHQITSHSVTTFRNDCRSPTHLTVSSTNTLRSMPALHRAPVFHPPIHHSLERKESSYSSLSPPTLTPVMPVNAGSKVQESQKPPTLIPEPKDSQANFKSSSDQSLTEMWRANNNLSKEKAEWHVEKSGGKSQAAVASVIVRPPSSTKIDNMPAMQLASKDRVSERSSTGANKTDCLKSVEAGETGRIILPNVSSDSAHMKSEKTFETASQGFVPTSVMSTINTVCNTKTDVFTSAPTTTSVSSWGSSEITYSLSNTILASTSLECTSSKNVTQSVAQTQECKVSTTVPVTLASNKTGSTVQPSSGFSGTTDFIHLKKHKAALAAAQYKSSNVSETELNAVKNQTVSASLPLDSTVICSTINKANSVGNGQASQTSQPNYHTKLKKAWLTRHSEEDKNTNKMENSGNSVSEIIKPCSVNLTASTSNDIQNSVDSKIIVDKYIRDDKVNRRKAKRTYESGSESGDSDESESKSEQRTKRQPKPTYKKKQNDLQKRKGEIEEDLKPNGVLSRSAKEKSKLKLQSSSNSAGIPRSVLKDWRKVKKLKQTGESFLQDDSCCEIGPNLQKCRECRLIRSKKGEEPTHSPVFCRFYYFRRLSFSKNGVVRIDGFSSPDQYDDEAMSLWTHENYEDDELDIETSKYILEIIGDKFCQLVTSEKTALSWVKKDAKIAWKRAVRGVREMCDACEATLFNIHWVCQKCGFVVCLDCYKAKERKSSRDKELYAWMKCVKGQPHDHKHLMPTQIIPGSVLTDLLDAMHILREKYGIKSHCHCINKQNLQVGSFPTMNGVSQVLQNVLNHSNKISLCMPESQQQNTPEKSESNGNRSPGSDVSTDSKLTPPESQSPLHWLADLAEQKAREEKKENKDFSLEKQIKEEREQDDSDSPNGRTSPPMSQNNEQGSTLRDLLTTTAGKLRVGSTDAGIAFAPVYSTGAPSGKTGRTMPNILDDIIASVVENKIPPNKTSKINIKPDLKEEPKERGKSVVNENNKLYSDIPHSWICEKHILWLKDYKNSNNWKLFKECWKRGQPAVVSGVHKKMNISLWKAESISLDFGDHQADLLNCKDSVISNANVKEFWDGFEEISKRQKSKSGETVVLKLKDCPSGEDFKTMMPARYEDLLKSLPLPEYCNPEGKFNLASHLPGFFVRPDLGPRLCSAYGVAAAKDHDIGTTNLHIEVSDVVNILVYVGIAKGNGILSKAGILKKFEEEDLDDILRKRLKDSSEIPGALWHIYAGKDVDKIREFLQKISKEQGLEVLPEHDPIRDQSWYVNKKLRQRLLEEYGVRTCTVIQFLGDAIVLPAGALHQVQNFHSCIQVTEDFVSPEHLVQSFHLTQELRLLKEEINYDDKLQVKNILYHAVKEMVRALKIHEDEVEDMEEN